MENSKRIQKEDDEMIEKLIEFTGHQSDQQEVINKLEFDNSNSFHSENSSDFYMFLEENLLTE